MACIFLTASVLAACGDGNGQQQRPAIEVGYVTVAEKPVTLSTDLAGRTSAYLASDVRPQVSGIITERLFKEGAMVKQGDALYQIEPSTYEAARDQVAAQLASAQASVGAARAKGARYDRLRGLDAVSDQDADDVAAAAKEAQAAVGVAKANLKAAEINLGHTRITAPISGHIGRSLVTPGALVTANQATALASIQTLDPIYLDITESSARILALRRAIAKEGVTAASAEIDLTLEDGSPYNQKGTVEFSEMIVDQETGTVTIRARVPNPQGLLLPGMYLRVKVPQAILQQGIMVPQQGISRDPTGKATALIVGEGDKIEVRDVVADHAIGDQWLITSGLKPGDRLVVEGVSKVRAGAQVKPVAVTLGKTD